MHIYGRGKDILGLLQEYRVQRVEEKGRWDLKKGGRGKGLCGGESEGAFSKARGHVNLGKM